MSETKLKDSELTVTQRLTRIQVNHDKCVAKLSPAMIECLPELHRDRNWLLQLVTDLRSENENENDILETKT